MGIYNNFIIQKGATWDQHFIWRDSNNNPINLTSYYATFQMKKINATNPQIIEFYPEIEFPELGQIDIYISPSETAGLETGYYRYELELYYPDNTSYPDIYRIMEGQLYVSDEVG